MKELDNLKIEGAHIIFRNFSGAGDRFHDAGKRGFSVLFEDPDVVQNLIADGWNLKELNKREEDDPPRWHLPVTVMFGAYPPAINLISGKKRVPLNEDDVKTLDYVELKSADLVIRPYTWTVNGKSGVKAYLKTGYFIQNQDDFADKYADCETSMPF